LVGVKQSVLKHVPEKHALGLDPMGGNRFSRRSRALPDST